AFEVPYGGEALGFDRVEQAEDVGGAIEREAEAAAAQRIAHQFASGAHPENVAALGDEIEIGITHGEALKTLADEIIGAARPPQPVARATKAVRDHAVVGSASHHALRSVDRTRTKLEQNAKHVKRSRSVQLHVCSCLQMASICSGHPG